MDLDEADELVEDIQSFVDGSPETKQSGIGGFACSYELDGYDSPVVMTTCDGVGTKLKLQLEHDRLRQAGWDLVAMNVNDILTSFAEPLQFLDYVAVETLDKSQVTEVIRGILSACEASGCELGGGETAELPGFLPPGSMELAGFCMGAIEADRFGDSRSIEAGDRVVGIPSNGFHANGFSLIREILNGEGEGENVSLIDTLLKPTRIYYPEVTNILESDVKPLAMAHITGGGISGNLDRVLPDGLGATIRCPEWRDEGARWILSRVPKKEAVRTFNMGMGWLIVTRADEAKTVIDILSEAREVGEITGESIHVEVESSDG